MEVIIIYVVGIVLWPILWFWLDGYSLFLKNKWVILPFVWCMVVLMSNTALQLIDGPVLSMEMEENLFHFLDQRSDNIINIIASILVISAVIYGVGDREIPRLFLRFVAATFIVFLAFVIPVVWVPRDRPEYIQILRAYQTVPFTYGTFFAITSILILLDDVTKWLSGDK